LILSYETPKVRSMARPVKDPDKGQRERVLSVRLADEEVEQLSAAAAVAGVSLSEFVRGTAVSASASYVPHAAGAAVK
jgi:uncharacterized protein (DUF1778 family)